MLTFFLGPLSKQPMQLRETNLSILSQFYSKSRTSVQYEYVNVFPGTWQCFNFRKISRSSTIGIKIREFNIYIKTSVFENHKTMAFL